MVFLSRDDADYKEFRSWMFLSSETSTIEIRNIDVIRCRMVVRYLRKTRRTSPPLLFGSRHLRRPLKKEARVFADNECRGKSRGRYSHVLFMTIEFASIANNESVSGV